MSLPPNRELLKEVKGNKRIFVETGSYRGDAIQQALDAGYERIISIDIDPENIKFCKNRFDLFEHPDTRITLYTMDSAIELWAVLGTIYEPVVFWLDAHCQYLEDEPIFKHPWPLLRELKQISEHAIKTHTILIDDLLILTHPGVTGWSETMICDTLLSINMEYNFRTIANPVINNLLIAETI